MDKKEQAKKYSVGSISTNFVLCIIFGLIGLVLAGLTGAVTGVIMVLVGSMISILGFIPILGVLWYTDAYNWFMDWLLGATGLATSMAVPRLLLFYIFGFTAVLLTIISLAVLVIIAIMVLTR